MKKLIILCVALLEVAGITLAQENKPVAKKKAILAPQAVRESFVKLYPDIKDAHWYINRNRWEAKFKQDEMPVTASFNEQGIFLYTETVIKITELPVAITDYAAKKYPGKKILRAEKMIDANGVLLYETIIKGVPHLLFDAQGNIMGNQDL